MTFTAEQIRQELDHLDHLRTLGPCTQPPTTWQSWCDPIWLDAWLRNNPHLIDQQHRALTGILARMNEQKATR